MWRCGETQDCSLGSIPPVQLHSQSLSVILQNLGETKPPQATGLMEVGVKNRLWSATSKWSVSALQVHLLGGDAASTAEHTMTPTNLLSVCLRAPPVTIMFCEEFQTFFEDEIKHTLRKNF